MSADAWLNGLVDGIRRRSVMTPGTLTSTMGRADHPVGMFLRGLTSDGVRALPRFPADQVPLLVDATGITGGEHSTIGTAFGWWLRLRLDPRPSLLEAQAARDLLPPYVQVALWELDLWIVDGTRLDEPGDIERAAVLLAWSEQLFRAGPAALVPCPLLRARDSDGPAELLDLVPDHVVEQLTALGRLADERLIAALAREALVLGAPLGRRPIGADADLVTGSTLMEIKCTKGDRRAAGATFSLGVDLVRQLLGYLLLDGDDALQADHVGVYAARFGLVWSMPAVEVIAACSGRTVTLAAARAAFARLWPPAA